MARVSRAAFVRRAWREDRTNRSTDGAASGCVDSRQPPATLRSTMPAPLAAYSSASTSSSASTVLRSTSRVWASAPAGIGSSDTNNTASMARLIPSRSGTGLAPLILHSTLQPLLPPDLDLSERLGLGKLDLPFTVKLQEGQEPDEDRKSTRLN